MSWVKSLTLLNQCLGNMVVTDFEKTELDHDSAFALLENKSKELRNKKKRLFFIGNGASASMASHFSADLFKNGRLDTQVFTDSSLITAIANDIAYDCVFSEPISRIMNSGDILVAISSSGQSPNVLKGVEQAKINGGFVVTLSAMKDKNQLRASGHLNFYVPAFTYGMAETSHSAILHHLVDRIMGDAP